ncbi:hypothetical protein V2J09_020588 [Rumex salicifolius]
MPYFRLLEIASFRSMQAFDPLRIKFCCHRLCFSSSIHSQRGLRIVMTFDPNGGYQDAFWRKMRFEKMLFGVPKLCQRSKHKYAEKLIGEIGKYEASSISDKSKLPSKVYVVMEYDGFHDERKKGGKNETPWIVESAVNDFDLTLACQRFPSITLGSSLFLGLYDDSASTRSHSTTQEFNKFFPESHLKKSVTPNRPLEPEIWPFLPIHPRIISPDVIDENTLVLQSHAGKQNYVSDHEFHVKDSSSCLAEEMAKPVEILLDNPISCIPGISKKNCRRLEESGFHTLRKLLHHFPRTYADAQNPHTGIVDGQYLIFIGRILSSKGVRASLSLSFLEVVVGVDIMNYHPSSKIEGHDEGNCGKRTIYLHLKKFFRGARFTSQPFLKCLEKKYNEEDFVCVSGKVRNMKTEDHYEMREYSLDVIEDESNPSEFIERRPYPIYPSKGGLKPQFLRDIIRRTLQYLSSHVDPIPQDITGEFDLLQLHDAYAAIHQPKDLDMADLARKRFIFDEFFYLQLGRLYQMLDGLGSRMEKEGLLEKYRNPVHNAVFTEEWSSLAKKFFQSLPYSLTSSQLRAASEIIWDLKRPIPMSRLLQGDVGCGKTIVAFLGCMEVLGLGYQGLQSGDISLVIGTHSLIADKVEFSLLRFAVIDEQHRFGVIQRGLFNSKLYNTSCKVEVDADVAIDASKGNKQMAPHVLAMSATPIPRTLALALYGDVSLTHITEYPPGRLPVQTFIVEGNEAGFDQVYQMMLNELQSEGKVYLVYPVIELSEQLPQLHAAKADLETISTKFPNHKCGLLHGKLKGDEKEEALRRFRHGETRILLATQVIEIGVDVPDASMMVVMNAERFGIAQLHQLRGRVGRGVRQSKCIMLASTASGLSRLKVLENSSDGFHLANVDLLLRGPGDLLGKKQSGHLPEFPVARLEIDGGILQEAHVAALKILSKSHDLEQFPGLKTELSMRQPLSLLGD